MRQPAFAFSGLSSLAHSGGKLFDVIEVAVYSFLRDVFSRLLSGGSLCCNRCSNSGVR